MDLREFNIRDIEPSSSWLILGPPGSGKSTFVEDTIGVSSVCEPCAYISGGELIVRRTAINGITIAISKGGE